MTCKMRCKVAASNGRASGMPKSAIGFPSVVVDRSTMFVPNPTARRTAEALRRSGVKWQSRQAKAVLVTLWGARGKKVRAGRLVNNETGRRCAFVPSGLTMNSAAGWAMNGAMRPRWLMPKRICGGGSEGKFCVTEATGVPVKVLATERRLSTRK